LLAVPFERYYWLIMVNIMFTVKQLLIKKFSRFEEFACSKKTSSDLQLKAHKPISAT